VALLLDLTGGLSAQTRPPARRPSPPPPEPVTAAAEMTCPTPLGVGVRTRRAFCDVMSASDPATGVLVALPPHRGPVTLSFDLHNRHTYSEEQVRAKRAFARYTAVIGALTLDNFLISRAAVESEFRSEADLIDRIEGGAGGGVKAVAPTGAERIEIVVPEGLAQLSLLGEKLTIERAEGGVTYSSPGRPIAVVSNVTIRYVPAPPPKSAPASRPPARPQRPF
jgi:hypothetical protein